MKVIRADNFDRDNVDDKLIEENLTADEAEKMADQLNEDSQHSDGSTSPFFYRVVEDDYKLKIWEP